MSVMKPYILKLKRIDSNLEKAAKDILKAHVDIIEFMLIEEQLHKGLDASGRVVGTYSPATMQYAENPPFPKMPKIPGQPYNFHWSGDFINKIYTKFDNEGFTLLSRDSKSQYLEFVYGKLLKLTEEHNDRINNEILIPGLYKYILDNLFKL